MQRLQGGDLDAFVDRQGLQQYVQQSQQVFEAQLMQQKNKI